MTGIAYTLVASVVMAAVAVQVRNGFVREFPRQNHDKPFDWFTYSFIGVCAGALWPLVLVMAATAWLLRTATRRWWS